MPSEIPELMRNRRFGFNRRTLRWAFPATAAALILAMLIPGFGAGQTETRGGLTFARGELEHALDRRLVADQRQGDPTRLLSSFVDADGIICRAFVRADLSGIACRRDGGWHLRVQRDGVDIAANDFRQAGAVEHAIKAVAQDMASGPAFTADQELEARASGWQR